MSQGELPNLLLPLQYTLNGSFVYLKENNSFDSLLPFATFITFHLESGNFLFCFCICITLFKSPRIGWRARSFSCTAFMHIRILCARSKSVCSVLTEREWHFQRDLFFKLWVQTTHENDPVQASLTHIETFRQTDE